jgi:FkbM family methyltransferase
MSFISYAQNFEDVMLWRAFKNITNGFYIDVGAAWPDSESTTKAFYDRGWSGINIEPNPELYKLLTKHRPRDINLCSAASQQEGMADFSFFENAGWSTLSSDVAKEHALRGHVSTISQVSCTTLASVWKQHVPSGQPVHFLKIDVEGGEVGVLAGNTWSTNRPWIIVVEATMPLSRMEAHEAWESIVSREGYRLLYEDGLNRFYAAEKYEELKPAFRYPPNFFDEFVLASELGAIHRAANAEKEAATSTLELEAMRNSRSWRATAPLRAVTRLIRSVPFATRRHRSSLLSRLRGACLRWLDRNPGVKQRFAELVHKLGAHSRVQRFYQSMKAADIITDQAAVVDLTLRAERISKTIQSAIKKDRIN